MTGVLVQRRYCCVGWYRSIITLSYISIISSQSSKRHFTAARFAIKSYSPAFAPPDFTFEGHVVSSFQLLFTAGTRSLFLTLATVGHYRQIDLISSRSFHLDESRCQPSLPPRKRVPRVYLHGQHFQLLHQHLLPHTSILRALQTLTLLRIHRVCVSRSSNAFSAN